MFIPRNSYTGILLLFFCLIIFNLSAKEEDNIHYSHRKEIIKVLGEKGYVTEVSYKGKFTSFENRTILIPYTELDSIYDIKAGYYNKKGKLKYLDRERIQQTSLLTSSFYDGTKAYFFEYLDKTTKEYPFTYNYTLSNKELITLGYLTINDQIQTDTFLYEIEVPSGYYAYFDTKNKENLFIDSTLSQGNKIYRLISIPVQKLKSLEGKTGSVLSAAPPAFLRLIVVPEAYRDTPFSYINSWYNKLVLPQSILNKGTENAIKSLVSGINNKDSITEIIFDYVRKKIIYIDVENGIGAFQPRDVNSIFNNKQGDCKDMANLLCQSLKFCGIEAYLALSSTLSHPYDLDFPSSSTMNHVICVARIDNKWQYLDATEMECVYGFPSRHIQGRNIFIINNDGGELHRVKALTPEENYSVMTANYFIKDNNMEGSFDYKLTGLIQMNIKTLNRVLNISEYNIFIQKYFESEALNVRYGTISTEIKNKETTLHGLIKAENKLIQHGSEKLMLLSFIPFPHPYPKSISKSEKIITFNTEKKEYVGNIKFDKVLKLKKDVVIDFSKNGFEFHFKSQQSSENSLKISYQFICNHLEIKDETIDTYNEINKLISQTFNSFLIYE